VLFIVGAARVNTVRANGEFVALDSWATEGSV
jgi:hypothetical protein